ncbi:Na+/H+ antiporter subunit E [Phycisphaerales bacterium AB-hyl4]|uniref:Na+/H+ antiporter subunit E n=1 Tax=Natronomicrosphaera hydrolytica TaxID=3242702 RepID=A0ABV4U7T8_9BACT
MMGQWLLAVVVRFVVFAVLWWVLAEGGMYQWWFGVAMAAVGAGLSLALLRPTGVWVNPLAVMRFVPFFLRQALLGGVDVGRRAVRRPLDVQPTFIDYTLKMESMAARVLFVCMVSLVPGTVSCELRGGEVAVHVLDGRMDARGALDELERHVGAMFGARG